MNRKNFLASVLPALALTNIKAAENLNSIKHKHHITIPPYLQAGDTIGITAPASTITAQEVAQAVTIIESWGFKTILGNTIGTKHFYFSNTDEARKNDLQQMLDDPNIKAILCARGGYGAVRIIDELNFDTFLQNPKWIIGFSDITVLHSHLHQQLKIASIHSKMCNSFPANWELADDEQKGTLLSIKNALTGISMQYFAPPHVANRPGTAKGIVIGGNLKTIESLSGSKSDISTKGKILFVEDVGEYLYSIDRMFRNLDRSGKFEQLGGLIVGGFATKEDKPDEPFGYDLYQIVEPIVRNYAFPVCFNFPVGHQKNNYAIKCGCVHSLEVTPSGAILQEKGANSFQTLLNPSNII